MIDDFDFSPREDAFDPFGVMLFKAMQVLAFLFFIALLSIAPDAKEGKVDPKAEQGFRTMARSAKAEPAQVVRSGTNNLCCVTLATGRERIGRVSF